MFEANEGRFMKKVLLMLSIICGVFGLCVGEGTVSPEQDFMIDFGVDFKNEYIFHGRNELHKVYIPRVKVGYQIFDGTRVYAGADSVQGLGEPRTLSRISPCVGVLYNITDKVILDAGYEYHFYTRLPIKDDDEPIGIKCYSNEIHLGIIFDTFIKSSLKSFYDFERKEVTFEGVIGYSFDLSFLFSGLGIDTWAKGGCNHTRKPMGFEELEEEKMVYYYYGTGVDLAYKVSHVRVKVGVGYEGNFAKKEFWINVGTKSSRSSLVFRAAVNYSF
jgi:opacity protein-like surface antigen